MHIAAAGAWLGANFVQIAGQRMMAARGSEVLAGWYRFTGNLSRPIYIPAGVLIVVTGVSMVLITDSYSFSDTFVIIGFLVVVTGAVLGNVVFEPNSERAASAAESGDRPGLRAAATKLATFGSIDTALILLAITVMVLRLGS